MEKAFINEFNSFCTHFLTPANSFAGVYGPGWITFPSVCVRLCLSVSVVSNLGFQNLETLKTLKTLKS